MDYYDFWMMTSYIKISLFTLMLHFNLKSYLFLPTTYVFQIRYDGRVVRTEQGLLLRSLQLSDGGVYQCTSTEKNFKHTLVKLQLVVLSARTVNTIQTESTAPAVPPLQSSAWTPSTEQYKDLLTILSQPEMGLINQYCQDYWQMGDDPAAHTQKKKDLKEVQKDLRKPRHRRHHEEQSSIAET